MKPLPFSILRLLSDGKFHSGETMAQRLGISRASIWNAVQAIEEMGVDLYKVRGRGYCLPEPMQFLDKQKILAELGDKATLFELELQDVVESTNSALMQKASLGAAHGSCLAVELQTQGRGRRGRTWHASLGGALTFSVLWRFNQGAGYLSGLSLAVGVALMRALAVANIADVALKWPNDVLHNYRKLAGVLIELQGEALGPSVAIIGIGLNLRLPDKVKDQIDQAVVDIDTISTVAPNRNRLFAQILSQLADVLHQFEAGGFAALREEWLGYHVYQHKPVSILLPNGTREVGQVLGVSDDGSLLVRTPDGIQQYASGEISLRGVTARTLAQGAA